MSDSPPQSEQQEMQQERSPPSTSSSPDLTEPAETKRSRKREREISLEPVTTPKEIVDVDSLTTEHRETRTPAKKNRTQLDTTEEEEDNVSLSRSNSGSPPQSASPPHEMKIRVRQISQGVEDLSWRNMTATTPERDGEEDSAVTPPSTRAVETGLMPAFDAKGGDTCSAPLADTDFPSTYLDVDNGDKSLKRKFVERGSQGPPETHETPKASLEPLKRPRDDADKDDNPRETKRPSPPPEPKSPKSPKKSGAAPRLSGFMAYASSSSPFAAVKGQNIFSSNKSSPSAPLPINQTPVPPLSLLSSSGESSSASATKRSGFEAFTSTSSPFSSAARSKSPVLGSTSKLGRAKSPRRNNAANSSAFSSYSAGLQSFAIPAQKRARAGSPNGSSRSSLERNSTISVFASNDAGVDDSEAEDDRDDRPVSFGEKLRAGKDDEDTEQSDEESKIVLQEQDLTTGEEEEDTIHQVRGKLFSLADGTQWKERGTGTLKLNVRRSDGNGARLVMRKEAVYTLLLNVTLFHGMRCTLAQDPRFVRFSVIEDGTTTHYNLKLASAKIANDLLEEINANIPAL